MLYYVEEKMFPHGKLDILINVICWSSKKVSCFIRDWQKCQTFWQQLVKQILCWGQIFRKGRVGCRPACSPFVSTHVALNCYACMSALQPARSVLKMRTTTSPEQCKWFLQTVIGLLSIFELLPYSKWQIFKLRIKKKIIEKHLFSKVSSTFAKETSQILHLLNPSLQK